jgi:hypothetical protein
MTGLEVLAQTYAQLGVNVRAAVERAVPEQGGLGVLLERSEGLVRRTLGYALWVGGAWLVIFWLGYYLVHR